MQWFEVDCGQPLKLGSRSVLTTRGHSHWPTFSASGCEIYILFGKIYVYDFICTIPFIISQSLMVY